MIKIWLFLFVTLSVYATEIIPYEKNKKLTESCEIGAACIFQHEGPWLKEWIEFHRLMGVQHFYLYNNLSNDNYLEVLEPYIERGIVELFDYPSPLFQEEDQVAIYQDAINRAKVDQVRWVAFIDADEFITPIKHGSLKDLLLEYQDDAGVYLYWQVFGTSGVEYLEQDELMIEKLTLKIPEDDIANMWGKTIVQTKYAESPTNSHWFRFTKKRCKIVPLQKARINHYLMRTEAYLRDVKMPRLQKWQDMGRKNMFNPTKLSYFLTITDYVKDDSMERFIVPLKLRMQ